MLIIIGSTPSPASLSLTLGSCSALSISRFSFSTMSRGVLPGRKTPSQNGYSAFVRRYGVRVYGLTYRNTACASLSPSLGQTQAAPPLRGSLLRNAGAVYPCSLSDFAPVGIESSRCRDARYGADCLEAAATMKCNEVPMLRASKCPMSDRANRDAAIDDLAEVAALRNSNPIDVG